MPDSYDKFFRIHIEDGKLVPQFNIRFARFLNDIPESYRPDDQMCLVVYFGLFDKKMNYLLRDKEPQTLYQAFMTARDIENNLKYGLTRSDFSKGACLHDEIKNKEQYHVEYSNIDRCIHSVAIVDNLIEN